MHKPLLISAILFLSLAMALVSTRAEYPAAKVVYDISSADAAGMDHLLDRVSLLQNLYDNDAFEASIVLVIHEGAIALFANGNENTIRLRQRAYSLTAAEIIEFRICAASARMQGFEEGDLPDFVRMVPMADGEIVMLQNAGYAYIRE